MEEVGLNQILPQHVAIVMDGNGRWAERQGLARVEGHRAGIKAVKTIVECCLQKKIGALSLFAFSSENWLRPEWEVDFLMQLFIQALEQEITALHERGVFLRFIGAREQLSKNLQKQMQAAEDLTCGNQQLLLNIAVNYSGKWDILQAVKKLVDCASKGELLAENITDDVFENALDTAFLPQPDLFIRTSGEQRISNFFLWQLAYTELYFSNSLWPDFSDLEFEKALTNFMTRERRYGQTSKQITGK